MDSVTVRFKSMRMLTTVSELGPETEWRLEQKVTGPLKLKLPYGGSSRRRMSALSGGLIVVNNLYSFLSFAWTSLM